MVWHKLKLMLIKNIYFPKDKNLHLSSKIKNIIHYKTMLNRLLYIKIFVCQYNVFLLTFYNLISCKTKTNAELSICEIRFFQSMYFCDFGSLTDQNHLQLCK